MSVRRRLVALLSAAVVVVGLVIATLGAVTWVTDHALMRATTVSARLDVLEQIAVQISAYRAAGAQVIGGDRDAGDTLASTKIALERLLARLTQVTRDEIAALGAMDEIQRQLPQIDASRRLLELFHAIDAASNSVRAMLRDGDGAGAQQTFTHDVAFRLDNEFAPLLIASVTGEQSELGKIADLRDATAFPFLYGGGIATVIAAVLAIWAGVALQQGVDDSIRSAAAQAAATEAGQAAELREANRQLRDLDQRRGQFLADVSHELRTPLTILRGEADVALRSTGDAGELRLALERIQGEAAELGLLIDDLLAFARTAQDDLPLQFESIRLGDLVDAAAQDGEMLAATREIRLTAKVEPPGCEISADFRRLKQALIIGIDNAVKQSPPGSAIAITGRRDGDVAELAICDEGSGIAEADLPRVFERFFRGKGADGSSRDGIGIGLAVARDIVERHRGQIGLANRPEGGAILTIRVPIEGKIAA